MGAPIDVCSAFAEAVDRLTGDIGGKICLAVSGGPDSLALLLLSRRAFADRIVAATVDHGLRPESAEEAQFVAEQCEKLVVQHAILRPAKPIEGNIQSKAREARYALLSAHAAAADCKWIATAHHADDQMETFLMRLSRGSGVDGLAGIRSRNGNIIRPLLQFGKGELEAICAEARIEPIRDPSNEDPAFDRVLIRKWLSETELPFDSAAVATSSAALADAAEALDWMSERLEQERIDQDGTTARISVQGLPAEIRRRLLQSALRRLDPAIQLRGSALARANGQLARGETTMLGDWKIAPGEKWMITRAPDRRG